MKIIILPFAEQDIRVSVAYYNEKDPVVSSEFLSVLDKVFTIISTKPVAFPIAYQNIRKFAISGFPYNVFYISEQSSIFILAVFHTKRNPRHWKQRLKK